MSTTIDSRVVEMRFDNRQFEKNCSETMSTLDKLKQKLHLDGASKGLDNVSSAAKKVDMNSLGNAVETVRARFSALEVMGVTALANITNSAINAGKQMLSSLTIAPINEGFSEYEMTLNAVQTTMAGTGKTAEEVEKELKKLDEYADKTVYSTSDMLNNLPKFTNAGVELEKATTAMIGIANATALAGGDAGKASIAFYNLGQAIGTGYLTRMDYNSINNAGIATMEWKEQMVEAAIAQGTLTKVGEDAYKAGNKTLSLQQLFIDGLQEQWATTDVLMKVFGDYGDETTEIGKKAYGAAQDIKTFSQMMESLKATAGTGWKDTWQIVFGGLDEAKKFWTGMSNTISNIITGMADLRNSLLGGALNMGDTWSGITEKIENSSFGKIIEVSEKVEDATKKLKEFQDVVNKVWHGDFGNVDTGRFEGLEEAGFDPRVVQELVNLGLEYELTVEDVEKAHEKFGLTMDKNVTQTKKLTAVTKDLTDEQLKEAGLTKGEIRLYRALQEEAKKTGKSIAEVAKEMSEMDGRSMLIESFKNAWSGLVTILKAVRDAWEEIFPPITVVQLYNAIKAVHEFSKQLKVGEEAAEKLKRTFKGAFAIVDVVATILGGAFKMALKAVNALLKYFNLDILDVTAAIGDAAVKFRDWIDSVLDFEKVFDKIIPPITNAIDKIREWIKTLKESENLPKDIADGIAKGFSAIFNGVVTFIKNGFAKIPEFINSGLVNGIRKGIQTVGQVLIELGKIILEKIKGVLGIHSPSTEFFEIGQNIILGLVNGIKVGASMVWQAIKTVGQKCIDIIKSIDIGMVFSGVMLAGGLFAVTKIASAIDKLAAPFAGLGDMFEEFGDAAKSVGRGVKNYLNSKALLSLAVAIGILALAVIKLSEIPVGQLWATIGAVAALALIIVGITALTSLLSKTDAIGVNVKAVLSLMAISAALLMLAWALAKLTGINTSDMLTTLGMFAGLIAGMIVISKACSTGAAVKMAGTLLAMSISLLIMTGVIAIIKRFDAKTLAKGIIFIGLFGAFVLALTAITSRNTFGKAVAKLGGTLIGLSIAILILTGVIALMDKLSWEGIGKGIILLASLGIFMIALVGIASLSKGIFGSKVTVNLTGTLIGMAVALLAFVGVIAVIDKLSVSAIKKGLVAIAVLTLLFAGLIAMSQLAGKNTGKIGLMLIGMSAAMLVLVGIIYIVSLMKPEGLVKGLAVVVTLGLMMAVVIRAGKMVKGAMGSIIAITAALVLLVGAIVILSFLDPAKMAPGLAAVSILLLTFGALVKAAGTVKNAKSLWKALIPLMLMVVMLGAIIWALGALNTQNAIENAAGLGVFLIAMATSMKIMNKVSRINKTAIKGMFAMAGVSVIAGLVLAMMGALKCDNAIVNAIALGIFMNTMATALKIADKVSINKTAIPAMFAMAGCAAIAGLVLALMSALKTDNAIVNAIALGIFMNTLATALVIASKALAVSNSAILGMFAMSVVAALGGLVLAMMSALNTDKAIVNAIALGIFMNTLSTALLIASGVFVFSNSAILGLAAMTVVAALGGLILAMMSALKTENAISNAIALGVLLNTMSTALVIASGVFMLSTSAILGLAAMTVIAALGGLILSMMSALKCDNAIENAIGLGILLNAMAIAMMLCGIAGIFAATALPGLAMIAAFIVGIGALIAGIGYLVTQFPDLEEFLNKGLPLLEKIGYGIGSFVGNLVGGALESLSDSLPGIADNLSAFGSKLNPFLKALKEVDSDSSLGIKYLAEAFLTLTGSGILNALTSWFTGGNSMEKFGEAMASLGPYVKEYGESVKGVDINSIKESAGALQAMVDVAKKIPNSGGIASWFAGNNDIDAFGTMMVSFGKSLILYGKTVDDLTEDHVTAIDRSLSATKSIIAVAKELPNSGGLWGAICGNNDMDEFGRQMSKYGSALITYANTVDDLTDDHVKAIDRSLVISNSIKDLAASLPNTGGMVSWFTGDNSLDVFGTQLSSYGTMLKTYATTVSTLTEDDIAAINNSVSASIALRDLAASIPESGGIFSFFGNNSNLDYFGQLLSSYATSLVNYAGKVKELDTTGISASVTVTKDLIAAMPAGDYSGISTLSKNLNPLTKSLTSYGKIKSEGMKNVTTEVKSLISVASDALGKDFSGLSSLSTALGKLGEDGVNKFVSSFDGVNTKMTNIGNGMMDSLNAAIMGKFVTLSITGRMAVTSISTGLNDIIARAKIIADASSIAEDAKDAIREYYDEFESAGSYLVAGLAAGINKNKSTAVAAAQALAIAVNAAFAAIEQIKSPSRVFTRYGEYIGEGLVIGLNDSEDAAYTAGEDLGKQTIDGAEAGISDLADKISDIGDVEATVSVVADTSDAEDKLANLGTIASDLFGFNSSDYDILRSIDVNSNNNNDDIVDKLDELIDVEKSADRSSYNINGITYAGDSELDDAVRIIVRAAKVERRR